MLAFFDSMGLIYTNMVPKDETVNAANILKTLDTFLVHMKKRPQLAQQGFHFHWDNAPAVHTVVVTKDWFVAHAIPVMEHAPYSSDLAPANFFSSRE